MKGLEIQVDFFRPLWRRVVLVVAVLGWALFEFIAGESFWGMLFGGLGVYALWQLFIADWPDADGDSSSS